MKRDGGSVLHRCQRLHPAGAVDWDAAGGEAGELNPFFASSIFHQAPAWWNGDGLNPARYGFRQRPRYGCTRDMEPNSETRGIYLARKRNGELDTGFDAKRVRKCSLQGDL